tara:strand:+ start:5258 stop:5542 length:285 start_codon:yes stop_codon:yes gene_type:complete
MPSYNYGTAIDKLIDNYQEMLELLIQARLASNRIDEWKNTLDIVINPEQTSFDSTNVKLIRQLAFKWICRECQEVRVDDERVIEGMKCRYCAYL